MKGITRHWPLLAGPAVTLALSFGWTSTSTTFKLLVLGVVAGFALATIILAGRMSANFFLTPSCLVSTLFLAALAVPLFFSGSPIAQQLYGTSGRNLGFFHYLFLTTVLLGISTLEFKSVYPQIIQALVVTGVFEATYGAMQFLGVDPAPWKNPDNWIFGTLGNPNYLSAFLALSTIATFYCALKEKKTILKLLFSIAALFQTTIAALTKSSQGIILVAFAVFAFIVIFCFQRSRILGWTSFLLGFMAGLVSVLGIFQNGPLSKYLYQDSISYRGDYWRAGIQMFEQNWVHGVGLDSYGDFYRMYRDATAANRRDVNVVSNTAHNLFIDLAATGGIFLIVGYLLIIGLIGFRILARFNRPEKVELEYKVLVVLWIAFNLQTIISINVPSLAIWGFMFSGLLLITENQTIKHRDLSGKKAKDAQRKFFVLSTVCCLLFISILAPLVSRDVKLAKVLRENDIPGITEALLSFPRDADQITGIALAYEKLGRSTEALTLAQKSLLENPNSARSWQVVFNSPVASSADKIKARESLEKLDPYYAAGLG